MSSDKFFSIAKNDLFPICRSITGKGIRKTLQIIKKEFPILKIHKIKSRTKVFDWTIPPEWNLYDGYILDKYNKKIVDFKKNNLHIVGYSTPINKFLSKKKLFKHIYSLPNLQNAIPYITSFYKKRHVWMFVILNICVSDTHPIEFANSVQIELFVCSFDVSQTWRSGGIKGCKRLPHAQPGFCATCDPILRTSYFFCFWSGYDSFAQT